MRLPETHALVITADSTNSLVVMDVPLVRVTLNSAQEGRGA